MISMDQARAMGAHFGTLYRAQIIYPDSLVAQIARAAILALRAKSPEIDALGNLIGDQLDHTSLTTFVPPVGTVIVIAPDHARDPFVLAKVSTHEAEHAYDLQQNGVIQEVSNIVGSNELNANSEGRAGAAGEIWMHYFLTGVVPDVEGSVESLRSWIYHLPETNIAEARAVLRSNAASALGKARPHIESARAALAWLQANAPELIVPEHLRKA